MSGENSGYTSPKRAYSHDITVDLDGNICRDGFPVRISFNRDTKYIHVGCTRLTRQALQALVNITSSVDEGELLLQDGSY